MNYYRSKCLFLPWSCIFQFNSILFNHISKRTCSKISSILNFFRSKCLFTPWSWVNLFYFFFSIQFNSIQFYFVKFQKRIYLRTLSILIILSPSVQINSIPFYFIISYFKNNMFKNIVNFDLFQI